MLDNKMVNVQDNVVKLNQYVKAHQDSLTTRGGQTNDLLVNLFKAYQACGEEQFLSRLSERRMPTMKLPI